MTRILGISGSPRRGGNTEILLDRALDGASKAGAVVEKIVLNGESVLVTIDSFQVMLRIMLGAEGKPLPPGVTKDSVTGKFIYLPQTVPLDYEKEVRTYLDAMEVIRSAA